ncbi:MAG: glycosyltransferase family 39 protein [Bacteroidales bacterium]|nr:glycosyltransferase family 39 protein [Bacteroidales bacterium]
MENKPLIRNIVYLNLAVSLIMRAILAATVELGNDEAYYRMYALYPDLSHFDHPPMVGYIIQLFSLNLLFDSEFFLRFGPVVMGTINTWLMFVLGKKIKNETAGLYASLLYSSSIYFFVIAGTFILPDTPLVLFWLLALCFFIDALGDNRLDKNAKKAMIYAGTAVGLGLLSKYTAAFLWLGAAEYILIYRKDWLKEPVLYLSAAISIVLFSPVILWNVRQGFAGLLYHQDRVSLLSSGIKADYIILELLGEILYHNPVNLFLIVAALTAFLRKNKFIHGHTATLILFQSIPIILIFISISLFRRTLPHWNGPGYAGLILLAASFLADRNAGAFRIPAMIKYSLTVLLFMVAVSFTQIKLGFIPLDTQENISPDRLGKRDLSLDLYGWKQLGEKTCSIIAGDARANGTKETPVIITYRWFPAANLDYYACRTGECTVITIGQLKDTHKFEEISRQRNSLGMGMDVYYLTTSRDYRTPEKPYHSYFDDFEFLDTVKVYRQGRHVMNGFVYKCIHLKVMPGYLQEMTGR